MSCTSLLTWLSFLHWEWFVSWVFDALFLLEELLWDALPVVWLTVRLFSLDVFVHGGHFIFLPDSLHDFVFVVRVLRLDFFYIFFILIVRFLFFFFKSWTILDLEGSFLCFSQTRIKVIIHVLFFIGLVWEERRSWLLFNNFLFENWFRLVKGICAHWLGPARKLRIVYFKLSVWGNLGGWFRSWLRNIFIDLFLFILWRNFFRLSRSFIFFIRYFFLWFFRWRLISTFWFLTTWRFFSLFVFFRTWIMFFFYFFITIILFIFFLWFISFFRFLPFLWFISVFWLFLWLVLMWWIFPLLTFFSFSTRVNLF